MGGLPTSPAACLPSIAWQIGSWQLYRIATQWGLGLMPARWRSRRSKAPSTPATMSKQHCRIRILQVKRFFRQSLMLLRHCCRIWQQCRTKFRRFDKRNGTCSICFDFVERTKFYDKLVRYCLPFFGNKVERSFDVVACCFEVVAGVDGRKDHGRGGAKCGAWSLLSTGRLKRRCVTTLGQAVRTLVTR